MNTNFVLTEEQTDHGLNILLNGRILVRLTPHIIFREGDNGSTSWEAYLNEKEGAIYLFVSFGNNTLVYFIRKNVSYPDQYLLENIMGIDLVPYVVMQGKVVNESYGFRELYIGGPAENGMRYAVIKLNPMYAPMIENVVSASYRAKFSKENIEIYMTDLFPDIWKESQLDLVKIK